MHESRSKTLSLVQKIGIGVAGFLILGATYLGGLTQGYYGKLTANNFGQVFDKEVKGKGLAGVDFGLYWTVLDLVKTKFYGDPDAQKLVYGSIKGMVAALGDRYSIFTDPDENKDFFDSLDGIYEGIGLEVDVVEGKLVVVSPLKDSPAEKAGLKSKDRILDINGEDVSGLTLDEALAKIKGPAGTKVKLTIEREGQTPFDIEITRQTIKRESVDLEIDENKIATIRIYRFANDTDGLMDAAVKEILAKKAKGVVLDLRNNPGGFLEAGVKVANEFLKSGLIVEERFKSGEKTPFTADGHGRLQDIPLVVLINGGSASASEIVSGAIQDANRGKLVGEKSFGKGSVQEVESLPDGSALRITVAKWYTPAGRSISDAGIKPDVEVAIPDDAKTDVQMEKAKALLTAK